MGRELVLRKALKDARKQHDVILIDCPPALGLLTVNGLVAADWALISSEAQYFALQGVNGALEVVEQAKEYYNDDLELLGVVHEHRRHAHRPLARGLRVAQGALRRQGVRHGDPRVDRLRGVGGAGDARSSTTGRTSGATTWSSPTRCSRAVGLNGWKRKLAPLLAA